jgi:chemotaxis protein methyltransferase CheR
VGLFRDSLCRQGFLGLGSKESLRFSGRSSAFVSFVGQEKIYQKTVPT